jgi:diaminopimelate epimerase
MRFAKMHGAGNDYVFVDLFEERVADAPALARAVSDRHKGIGSDGLILLAPSRVADVAMAMYNADGSRAQMCGNGIRCLAKLAWERGRTRSNPMRVETDAGVRTVELLFEGGKVRGAEVDMGAPVLDPALIPVRLPGPRVVDHPVEVLDRTLRITCVSMGNPHAVVFVDDVAAFDVARFGPVLETHPLFPERTNAEFVEVLAPGAVRQRTWERGAGETQACGTGACAVCVAGALTGRTGPEIRCELPGGELRLEWDGSGSVRMRGDAVLVFTGEWPDRGV